MFITYSQAKEDIHLLRALYGVHHDDGFYIDVGAFHPDINSVTKLFYDAGWRGINVEPSPTWFRYFPVQRPRDINLNVAVAEKPGQIDFYDDQKGGLGTASLSIADDHAQHGYVTKTPILVEAVTLTSICNTHCRGAIYFLKVDVEGTEGAVLRSMDFSRYRPWVLCVESHYPLRTDIQLHTEWENYLIFSGYRFAYTDLINRYYVAAERQERMSAFNPPADDFRHVNDVRRVAELEQRVSELEAKLSKAEAPEAAR